MLVQGTLLLFLILVLTAVFKEVLFRQNTYFKITGNGYFETLGDTGKYGEYLTYKGLKAYEADGGRFLFNCYIPKGDGATTEIDVILVHSTGIFVFESKNYSGWIFGSEKGKTWTQTLRSGNGKSRKEHFYNPIMQNNTHVKWLKKIVGDHVPVYSVIVFSERCTLKDVTVESLDIKVINRQHINGIVKQLGNRSIQALSKMDIERIYEMLYPYTQTTEHEKLQHIDQVNTVRYGGRSAQAAKMEDTLRLDAVDDQTVIEEQDSEAVVADNASKPESEIAGSIQHTQAELPADISEESSKKICPRCKSELVLRTAKKGEHAGEQFYGCSRFPKCRYKESL